MKIRSVRIDRIQKSLVKKASSLMPVVGGNFLIAIAVNAFLVPSHLIAGGSAGLALVLSRLLHLPFEGMTMVVSMSCFGLGLAALGWHFAARTLISAFIYPVFIQITAFLTTGPQSEYPLLCGVAGGLLMGAGMGLILRAGASSGGLDIPPIVLERKTGLPVSVSMFGMDLILLGCQIPCSQSVQIVGGFAFIGVTYLVMNGLLSSKQHPAHPHAQGRPACFR